MKRVLSISVLGVFIATACGRSVDLGGDKSDDPEPGGAGGEDERSDDGRTGGNSSGGVAGAHGGSRPAGGSNPGGDGGTAGVAGNYSAGAAGVAGHQGGSGGDHWAGFGGIAGDWAGSGGIAGDWAGSGGVAGDYWAGSGGVAGNYWAGSGGASGEPMPPTLPRCITDLYEPCWPSGACRDDAADATRCYESGVKVVTEALPNACGGAIKRYYKADGTLCFSFIQGAVPEQFCETAYRRWYGPDGALVAEASTTYTRPFSTPTCLLVPPIPCVEGTAGAAAHCEWPTSSCGLGECPFPRP